jgi:purine-binding chemotaxis protein CheW
VELLIFQIEGRQFALAAQLVRQVTRAVAVVPLPKAPPIVEGVINVRGSLAPVLDIRHRFGLAPAPLSPDQHFVIAQAGPRLVALRVDRALEIVSVDKTAIEPAAQVAPGTEYVSGIARLADGLLVIHDLERFLSLEETEQVGAAMSEAQ